MRNVFSRFSFVLWLFLLNILDDEQHKKNKKRAEEASTAAARNSILANNIFSYFSIQFSIFKLSKTGSSNTWKKASAGQQKERGRETEHIYMGCRVMDPLKCTTIAVKSKNVSAFVFIVVVVVVGVKSCCGLSINNTLCQGVSFFTVEKKRAGNRLISSAHSWTGANVRQVAAVLPGSHPRRRLQNTRGHQK